MDTLFDDGTALQPPLSAAFEPNDSVDTAATIDSGSYTITGEGQDWYQFDVQAGYFEVTMTPDDPTQNYNLVLRNATNAPIAANFTDNGAETISQMLPTAGTYYLFISTAQFGTNPPEGTALNYTLNLDLPQEVPADNNNTMTTATPLAEGNHQILGREVDWHQLTATAGFVDISMTAQDLLDDARDTRDDPRDLNLALFNSAGQVVASSPASGNTESFTYLIPADGTYFLRVMTAQFGTGAPDGTVLSYSLDVDYADPLTPDNNDSLTTATALAEGTSIFSGTGQDWHRIDSTSGLLGLTLTPTETTWPDGSPVQLNLTLFNSAGAVIASGGAGDGIKSISHLLTQDGTYYARVFWADRPDGVDNVPLNYTLDLNLPDVAGAEDNDTRTTADTLFEGTASHSGTGVDWYRFESLSGVIDLSLTETGTAPDGGAMHLNMVLEAEDGTVLGSVNGTNATKDISRLVGSNGTYYLKVFWAPYPDGAPNGAQLQYDLTLDLPAANTPEDNDTATTAPLLPEGTGSFTGTGVDWHRIESSSGQLNFSLTETGTAPDGSAMTLNMVLVDADGTVRASTDSGDTTKTLSNLIGTGGTYYLKVFWAPYPDGAPNGVQLQYDLTLDLPTNNAGEANDSRATAPTLPEGTSAFAGTTVDWHRIESPSGLINFSLTETGTTPDGDPMTLNMVLENASGDQLASVDSNSSTKALSKLLGSDDTYFLKVFWAPFPDGAPNGVQLQYDLTMDLPDVDATEPNDSRDTAPTLAAGTTSHTGTGVDWHRIDSPSGLLNLSMTQNSTAPDGTDMNLNIVLEDADGIQLASNDSLDAIKTLADLLPRDGSYYLKVFWAPFPDGAPNGTRLSYALTLDLPTADPAEADDVQSTGTLVTADTTFETHSGTDVDWYRIVSGPGMMKFNMSHLAGTAPDGELMDLNMQLYDANNQPVGGEAIDFADEAFTVLAPVTGTYYLKVFWAPFQNGAPNGTQLTYSLDIDLPDNTWSTQLDFGPVRNASVAAYDIDKDGKDEIFVGTSKAFDTEGNEIRPGGLIVLEDDGTVKWTKTFAAYDQPDPNTGKMYNSTSVSAQPVFSDVNGDGTIDIIVGVGADNRSDFGAASQPGDLGGLYAVDASGNTLWFHQTKDSFGGSDTGPDGRPDGVYSAPRVFDIDVDGVREVIFTSWDHYLYVLDGRTGSVEKSVDLHDTAGATPAVADLDNDGIYELVVPADITTNTAAGLPDQGGILHVLTNYGQAIVPGWDTQVATSTSADFRGKFEPQSLWSSPKVVDLDRDGTVEIIQGTGNFFLDDRGQYVKIWNADGTLRQQLDTTGRVLASPLVADLDGNGTYEIIAATVQGHVHAFSSNGTQLFDTEVLPYNDDTLNGVDQDLPIARQPVAVDIDNADGDLEILVSIGSQVIILDSDGTQLTNQDLPERAFSTYAGSPVAKDIDGDGKLDIVSGGTTLSNDQAVIFRFENITDVTATDYRTAEYQGRQSLHEIQAFVDRFYSTILGRNADPGGLNDWTDKLYTGVQSGASVASGFIFSQEFIGRGTTNAEYVNTLYAAFFGRPADTGGFNGWMTQMDNGATRADVLDGFIGSREFINLSNSYGIRANISYGAYSDDAEIVGNAADSNVLRGGAGDNTLYDEGTTVVEQDAANEAVFGQVYRIYGATLGRVPDSGGFLSWYDGLTKPVETGGVTLLQAITGFVNSAEFQATYGTLTNSAFVDLLYQNVLGRPADPGGLTYWTGRLDDGDSRAQVVLGFSESGEYRAATNSDLDSYMRSIQPKWKDVLEGGAGNDAMNGGIGSDIFVFRAGQGGNDTIHGFEPWDQLQLSGFGFNQASQALSHMTQSGANVVFSHSGQTITFLDTGLSEMSRVKYNLS